MNAAAFSNFVRKSDEVGSANWEFENRFVILSGIYRES